MLLSTLLFASMSALVKLASTDVSIPALLLFRNLPSALVLYAFAQIRGRQLRSNHWRLHAMRCGIGLSGMVLGFYAIRHLPLATASTLEYTAPLFLMLAYVVMRRRGPGLVEVATILVGFAGVLLLLRPTMHADQALPFLVGLASGACAAGAYRSLFRLGQVGEPGWRIVFIYSSVGTVCGLLALPMAADSTFSPSSVLMLIGIGVFGLGGQLTMTQAFSTGSTSMLATLQYTTLVFTVCYGVLFWGDMPSLAGAAGLVLVVLSGIMAARRVSDSS